MIYKTRVKTAVHSFVLELFKGLSTGVLKYSLIVKYDRHDLFSTKIWKTAEIMCQLCCIKCLKSLYEALYCMADSVSGTFIYFLIQTSKSLTII